MMLGGLFTAILVGYKILPEAEQELSIGLENPRLIKAWKGFVRYLIPPVLVVVLAFSIPKLVAAVRGLLGI